MMFPFTNTGYFYSYPPGLHATPQTTHPYIIPNQARVALWDRFMSHFVCCMQLYRECSVSSRVWCEWKVSTEMLLQQRESLKIWSEPRHFDTNRHLRSKRVTAFLFGKCVNVMKPRCLEHHCERDGGWITQENPTTFTITVCATRARVVFPTDLHVSETAVNWKTAVPWELNSQWTQLHGFVRGLWNAISPTIRQRDSFVFCNGIFAHQWCRGLRRQQITGGKPYSKLFTGRLQLCLKKYLVELANRFESWTIFSQILFSSFSARKSRCLSF